MYKLLMIMICSVLISLILWFLFYQLNKMESWDSNNSSSFECGFYSFFNSRYSYSIPYFFLTLVFLFLDLELCLILPYFFFSNNSVNGLKLLMVLILVILFSLFIEWKNNSLDWLE